MVRPIEVHPAEPTEELRIADGSARPIGDAAPGAPPRRVEPAAGTTATIGGGRRTLLVGLAVGVLVVAVAGLGFAGRSVAPVTAEATGPVAGQPASGSAAGADRSRAEEPGSPGADALGAGGGALPGAVPEAGFPVEVDGLLVVSIERARREAGGDEARPLAVAGWLSVESTVPTACVIRRPASGAPEPGAPASGGSSTLDAGPTRSLRIDARSREADFCRREGVLRSRPGGSWGEPHLHPQFLPGLSLWPLPEDPGDGVPAVLIGHYRDARSLGCVPDGRNCGHELVVDRVAWAAGRELPRSLTVALADPSDRPSRPPARAASIVERDGDVEVQTVSVAGIPGQDLHQLDADAAAVVREAGHAPDVAWYVRFIVPEAVNGRVRWTSGWAVVDDATGTVIAREFG